MGFMADLGASDVLAPLPNPLPEGRGDSKESADATEFAGCLRSALLAEDCSLSLQGEGVVRNVLMQRSLPDVSVAPFWQRTAPSPFRERE